MDKKEGWGSNNSINFAKIFMRNACIANVYK